MSSTRQNRGSRRRRRAKRRRGGVARGVGGDGGDARGRGRGVLGRATVDDRPGHGRRGNRPSRRSRAPRVARWGRYCCSSPRWTRRAEYFSRAPPRRGRRRSRSARREDARRRFENGLAARRSSQRRILRFDERSAEEIDSEDFESRNRRGRGGRRGDEVGVGEATSTRGDRRLGPFDDSDRSDDSDRRTTRANRPRVGSHSHPWRRGSRRRGRSRVVVVESRRR